VDVFYCIIPQLLITSLHDADDIFKVMGSKAAVTDNISQKCTFPAEICGLMLDYAD